LGEIKLESRTIKIEVSRVNGFVVLHLQNRLINYSASTQGSVTLKQAPESL
jgi:hypothetical protein